MHITHNMFQALARKKASGGGLWTPSLITTDGWWDASDTATIDDTAGAVNQINDKSGGTAHFVQSNASNKMTTGTRTQNSLNVLDNNGSQFMSVSNYSISSNDCAFFMVAGIDSAAGATSSIFATDGSNDMELDALSSPNFDPRLRLTFQTNPTTINNPHNGPSIYNAYFDWTNSLVGGYIDGAQDLVERAYTTQLDMTDITLYMFANFAGGAGIDGFMAEFLIVPDCTSTCRQKLEGYFAHEWGLTANLPADHPYKSAAPTA